MSTSIVLRGLLNNIGDEPISDDMRCTIISMFEEKETSIMGLQDISKNLSIGIPIMNQNLQQQMEHSKSVEDQLQKTKADLENAQNSLSQLKAKEQDLKDRNTQMEKKIQQQEIESKKLTKTIEEIQDLQKEPVKKVGDVVWTRKRKDNQEVKTKCTVVETQKICGWHYSLKSTYTNEISIYGPNIENFLCGGPESHKKHKKNAWVQEDESGRVEHPSRMEVQSVPVQDHSHQYMT